MLALSPSLFAPTEWTLEEPTSHNDPNLFYKDGSTPQFSCSPPPGHDVEVEEDQRSPPISLVVGGDPTMVKKRDHNASERDRRKKINSLYSSLRSMLPLADQTKKLSIPATISRIVKYIPELQQQVEMLIKKKEELFLRTSRQGDASANKECRRKMAHHYTATACVVSTSRLTENEAVFQISSDKLHKTPLSEILLCLEKEGLLLLNASTFDTFGHRVFYNLHFQTDETCGIEPEILREKILAIL
ncbi:hypothetical protein QN277_021012 [Acacia crassicarpa]|uniref:BHLH domain-containing protein n=1 Tax=Acacia crassicarpa TaxID=499986 RepID=A0AAE1MQ18_9FABA|nr:hypothetical protein QN277_021012 [Acacia crassicarpa]